MQNLAPFVCEKDVDRDPPIFPRNSKDIAVIAQRVGSHPNGFIRPFLDHRLMSTCSKQNTSYGSVPSTKNRSLNRGSRSVVCFSGKKVSLLTDLISLHWSLGDCSGLVRGDLQRYRCRSSMQSTRYCG